MKQEKSNIDHLRDIIKRMVHTDKEEALEFLDAIEEEYKDMVPKTEDPDEEEEDDLEEEEREPKYAHADYVMLDTVYWKLENRNIKIEMQMEAFIEGLKKENGLMPLKRVV